jgi:hypothetical protein
MAEKKGQITTTADLISAAYRDKYIRLPHKKNPRQVKEATLSTLRGGCVDFLFHDGTSESVGWSDDIEFSESDGLPPQR